MYVGFWRRLGAYLIDALIIGLAGYLLLPVYVVVGAVMLGGITSLAEFENRFESALGLVMNVITYLNMVWLWLYYAYMEASVFHGTIGKVALGLAVVDENGERLSFKQATARYWSKYLSVLTLFVGFIMAGFTRNKQALHDKIASTFVVDRRAPEMSRKREKEVELFVEALESDSPETSGAKAPFLFGARSLRELLEGRDMNIGFWKRLLAYVIDMVLLIKAVHIVTMVLMIFSIPVMAVIGAAASQLTGADSEEAFENILLGIIMVVSLVVCWLYFVCLESSKLQGTFGKLAVGAIVTDSQRERITFARANGRFWSRCLSALPVFMGYIMTGFTESKQALHDRVPKTYVVNREVLKWSCILQQGKPSAMKISLQKDMDNQPGSV
ncbi:RDD family protein [Paenibacillus terreus]|uniref:RDD family protein n=1 Tax=Paenibacillus terreus TaxID=1387834 RepID=A0ABV5B3R2_9BACL